MKTIIFAYNLPPAEPYLHPAYWDGNAIGTGEPAIQTPVITPDRAAAAYATDAINAYRDRTGAYTILDRYTQGDAIDPQEFAPGTILGLGYEVLNKAGDMTIELEPGQDWKDIPVPARPSIGESRHCASPGLSYIALPEWGVVVPSRRKRPQQLVRVPGLSMDGPDPMPVAPRHLMDVPSEPIEIGKVQHERCACTDHAIPREGLSRTIGAVLFAPGEVKTQRDRRWFLLGRLAASRS